MMVGVFVALFLMVVLLVVTIGVMLLRKIMMVVIVIVHCGDRCRRGITADARRGCVLVMTVLFVIRLHDFTTAAASHDPYWGDNNSGSTAIGIVVAACSGDGSSRGIACPHR